MEIKQITNVTKEKMTMFLDDIEKNYDIEISKDFDLNFIKNTILINNFVLHLDEIEKIYFREEFDENKKIMYIFFSIDLKNCKSGFNKCYFTF